MYEVANIGGERCGSSVCGVRMPDRDKISETVVLREVQKEKKEKTAERIPKGIRKGGEDEITAVVSKTSYV